MSYPDFPTEPPCGPIGISDHAIREWVASTLHQIRQKSFRCHLASCRGQNAKQAEGLRGESRGLNEAAEIIRHHFKDYL